MLSDEQKKALLKLARDSIKEEFTKERVELPADDVFNERRGVFVTLHKEGSLRGCIGFPIAMHNLSQGILRAAKSAAFEDPRFDPLTEDEVDKLVIEISVLTVPEVIRVMDPKEYEENIKVGRDGLMVKSMDGAGLLLPQVFIEYDCDSIKAIEMTCQKAGLAKDAWKDLSVKVYKFEAEVFGEGAD
ncbi:AmmeMemoRadiSam system protein A [Thermoproteota archaeon]